MARTMQTSTRGGPRSLHSERSSPPNRPENTRRENPDIPSAVESGLGLSMTPTIHLGESNSRLSSPEPLSNGQVPRNAYNRADLEEAKHNRVGSSLFPQIPGNQHNQNPPASKVHDGHQAGIDQIQDAMTGNTSSHNIMAEKAVKDVANGIKDDTGRTSGTKSRSHTPAERKTTTSPARDAAEDQQPAYQVSNTKKRQRMPRPTSVGMWGGQPANETLTTKRRQRSQTADSIKSIPPINQAATDSEDEDAQQESETLATKKRRRGQATDSGKSVTPVAQAMKSKDGPVSESETREQSPPKHHPGRPLKQITPTKAAKAGGETKAASPQVQVNNQNVAETSVRKRHRGRPPKVTNPVEAAKAHKEAKAASSQVQVNHQEDVESSTTKRPRGRPPQDTSPVKAARTSKGTKAVNPEAQVKNQEVNESSVPKRTRGRPPKDPQAKQTNKEPKSPVKGKARVTRSKRAAPSRHTMRTRTERSK